MDDDRHITALEATIRYHDRSKHRFDRYAPSPGYMDWENQPNPFRFYEGVEPEPLSFLTDDPGGGHEGLYLRSRHRTSPVDRSAVAGFLELCLGLSAWKMAGASRWSLRINPSSGNLHPTEAHLILPPDGDRPAGRYHYSPFLHALEPLARVPGRLWQKVEAHLGSTSFLLGLSSIFWRESWKYGERAFRYCQHDAGHALAAAAFSAALLGWKVTPLSAMSDRQIEQLLGFDQINWHPEEKEHADLLCAVHPADAAVPSPDLPDEVLSEFSSLPLSGRPNRLSRKQVRWPAIAEIAGSTRKPEGGAYTAPLSAAAFIDDPGALLSAAQTIRRRRSALDFNPEFILPRRQFLAMLDKTRPRPNTPPFDAAFGPPEVHLLIFAHRIEGLDSGMYLLVRNPAQIDLLRGAFHPHFSWDLVEPNFPLFALEPGDFRQIAMRVSCHQHIAGDGAFSLAMIARFEDVLRTAPWHYRRLFWESGMIGQVLYLEAEARGARGTGIGCYFDDAVHELAGIEKGRFQSMYHFTVGLPVNDPRLQTRPPYAHLDNDR
ncbi:MAG: SagB/ThcOx family dehydrogenase [Desulfobacterales bacterium]|nr:SagB/ThcOx family dehydrogenase [Desulfobacterales bacterium]